MLSVIIGTLDSEGPLVATLAALFPGAMEGLVSEVIVADGGSHDGTATVADVAGCNFTVMEGPLGRRLKTAATTARAPWLLFLRPGIVLDAAWTGEVRRFTEQRPPEGRAAAFRRGRAAQPALWEMLSLLAAAAGALPRPEQGLLIAHAFYDELGGHSDGADPETELIRRIGRRRITTLAIGASVR
jgi:glycosyltransferase involved in cell wall biosynthesis